VSVRRWSQSGLYGFRANNLQAWPPIAFGGTITTAGGFRIHTFTTVGSDTFQVVTGISNVEYLIVAGGGGAGTYAGGGGAGEVVWVTGNLVSPGPYGISVGAGGIGSTGVFAAGMHGSSSGAFGQNAKPGGGAKSSDDSTPGHNAVLDTVANGGGGSSRSAGYFGSVGLFTGGVTGTRYGGNRGGQTAFGSGSGNQQINYPGGGGGGAGASVTSNSGGTNATSGGAGILNSINGSPLYWSAGGGGSCYYGGTAGNGGIGGGGGGGAGGAGGSGGGSSINLGQSGSTTVGGNGGVNTGSGGGGGRGETSSRGGDGGSGIVIIRYPL